MKIKKDGNNEFRNKLFEIIVGQTVGNQSLVKLGKLLSLKNNSKLNKLTVKIAESIECKTYLKSKEQILTNHVEERKQKYIESLEDQKLSKKEKESLIQTHLKTIAEEINLFSLSELIDLREEIIDLDYDKVKINISDIRVYELPKDPSPETIKLYDDMNFNERDMFHLKDFIEFVLDEDT